jgi:hypothetical protein
VAGQYVVSHWSSATQSGSASQTVATSVLQSPPIAIESLRHVVHVAGGTTGLLAQKSGHSVTQSPDVTQAQFWTSLMKVV